MSDSGDDSGVFTFHHEFATCRFRPLSEHGSWQGRSDIVPAQR